MGNAIALMLQLGPLVTAGVQLFGTIEEAFSTLRKAQAEKRDLTDEELARFTTRRMAAEAAWAEMLARLRTEAPAPDPAPEPAPV